MKNSGKTSTAEFTMALQRLMEEHSDEEVTRESVIQRRESWLRDGYILQRLPDQGNEPQIELSVGAHEAIHFLIDLENKHHAPTTGQLDDLIYAITSLNFRTNKDPKIQLEYYLKQREQLDDRIERTRLGLENPPTELQIIEEIEDIRSRIEGMDADLMRFISVQGNRLRLEQERVPIMVINRAFELSVNAELLS